MKEFVYHQDPGHGWVAVSPEDLAAAGMKPGDFSAYSYRYRSDHGARMYFLEEDCDAPKFVSAWNERVGPCAFREIHTNGEHWIRDLERIA